MTPTTAMLIHFVRITAITAFIILLTALPFLPGRYDPLAVSLSLMAQLFGKVGLVLVPVGALWLLSEYRSRHVRKRFAFAVVALIASSVVGAMVVLGAFVESMLLGLGLLALSAHTISRLLPRLRSLKSASPGAPGAAPFYFVIVPVTVTLIQLALEDPLTESARSRAIRNSAALIADIERYRVANGRYPESTISVNKDYWPSVIGVREYLYEPSGDTYNVVFELHSFRLGTREIVVYNPLDQHAMTSHAMDRLQLTPAQLRLDQSRGHNELHDAPFPHWKYYWYD